MNFSLIVYWLTVAVKQSRASCLLDQMGRFLSMLSALLTLAVNQTSQEVRGQNVWASERRRRLSMARI